MLRTGSAIRLMVYSLKNCHPNPLPQMDQTFDSVKELSLISEKNWCIKVRILRMWKVPSYEKSYS
ncbi:hypothetical protein Ahy_A07g034147 isoform B [Arachis hypogaea]|uniref:Uncharacterized protein n=1 Tax=Arachis hypogaea TaxID=3818 RepID=A0A445CBC5_ARAHY|nr:hypothetical protein Ahy_A07g034147 isoform B [Arachis hypogaea]